MIYNANQFLRSKSSIKSNGGVREDFLADGLDIHQMELCSVDSTAGLSRLYGSFYSFSSVESFLLSGNSTRSLLFLLTRIGELNFFRIYFESGSANISDAVLLVNGKFLMSRLLIVLV